MKEILENLILLLNEVAELVDEFSDEELDRIFKFFEDSLKAIEILAQQGKLVEPSAPLVPEVPAGEFPSSNVNGFKYNPETNELFIQFHGPYPKADGPIYKYSNVPEFIFKVLQRGAIGPRTSGKNRYHEWIKGVTPSYGAVVNALVKAGGYPYQKLS